MCWNCGCEEPKNNMGNPDNITDETVEKAAKAASQSKKQALINIIKMAQKQLEDM